MKRMNRILALVLVGILVVPVSGWAAQFKTMDSRYDDCKRPVVTAYYEEFGVMHPASQPVPEGGWTKFQEDQTRPGVCACVKKYPTGSVAKFDAYQFGCPKTK